MSHKERHSGRRVSGSESESERANAKSHGIKEISSVGLEQLEKGRKRARRAERERGVRDGELSGACAVRVNRK